MKNNGYTLVEICIITFILSIILSFTLKINININNKKLRQTMFDISSYNLAVYNFKNKYGYLPGDIQKTEIFNLSLNNTDGNQNNLIEDNNQANNINEKKLQMNNEILNFWLHLYNSNFLKKGENIFPYLESLNTGILVFSKNNKNYYHISVNGLNKNLEIETINNLTPNFAYLIDKKFDDGLPNNGLIQVAGESYINGYEKPNKKCSSEKEYLTVFQEKLCSLIIELNI